MRGYVLTSSNDFRTAMSKFATGVTVVTSVDEQGNPHSMTANSFTSVCLDPPTLLVCVAHGTNTYGFVERTGKFGVNILNENQEDIGIYFAKRPEDRTGEIEYEFIMANGNVPFLSGSMVSFSCKVVGSHVYGDHTVYMGEVIEVCQQDEGEPLMFFKSRWYHPRKS